MENLTDARRPPQRDSHELSEQLARYSVVDSMLQSLGNFSNFPPEVRSSKNKNKSPTTPTNISTSFPNPEDDPYVCCPQILESKRMQPILKASISEFDPSTTSNIDETASKFSAYHAQGRIKTPTIRSRRNSRSKPPIHSNNYPASTSYPPEELPFPIRANKYQAHSHNPSRTSSIDGLDWNPSTTTDILHHEKGLKSTPKRAPRPPPLETQFPHDDMTDLDAAPTPTVHGGPRKRTENLTAASPNIIPSRQNSTKSSKTTKRGKTAATTTAVQQAADLSLRDQARQFVSAANNIRNAQTVTPSSLAPTPTNNTAIIISPTLGSMRQQQYSTPNTALNQSAVQLTPKEKTGFFRKFFGSSKNANSTTTINDDSNPIPLPPHPSHLHQKQSSSISHDRPKTQPTNAPSQYQSSTTSRPPTQDPHSSSQTLRKSTSAFFRRRRNPMHEQADPLPPLPALQPNHHNMQNNPSAFSRLSFMGGIQGEDNNFQHMMASYLVDAGPTSPKSPRELTFDHHDSQPKSHPGETQLLTSDMQNKDQPSHIPNSKGPNSKGSIIKQATPSSESPHPSYPYAPVHNGSSILSGKASKPLNNVHSSSFPSNLALTSISMSPITSPSVSGPSVMTNFALQSHPVGGQGNLTSPALLSPISDRSFLISSTSESASPTSSHTSHTFQRKESAGDEYIISQTASVKNSIPLSQPVSNNNNSQQIRSQRVWLKPSDSEEQLRPALPSPVYSQTDKGNLSPKSDAYHSAVSHPYDGTDDEIDPNMDDELEEEDNVGDGDRTRARQIFEGDESFVTKALAASWLGQKGEVNTLTRKAYMDLFDWTGQNILSAFRELCSRLIIKAEAQQLDRVIDGFSERWSLCNPTNGFKNRDVVHTIAFSILMLNTDLHLAAVDSRMTRNQFVKNTLPTLKSIAESSGDPNETIRRTNNTGDRRASAIPNAPLLSPAPVSERSSFENRSISRSGHGRYDTDGSAPESTSDGTNLLVNAPCEGSMKTWESQVEIVLKDFYSSIRSERLPLHGAAAEDRGRQQSTNSLSVITATLRRSPSVLSKAPSENASFRGRPGDMHSATGRFSSKNRLRQRPYPSLTVGSSRTSLDDQSLLSPTASTYTKYSSHRTQTTFSVESFSGMGHIQPIGFANSVSQAMIREEYGTPVDSDRPVPLLEDESLELEGPPWAKEGLIRHKIHDRKSKDRGWAECFAVVEKGNIRLFSFNATSVGTGGSSHSTLKSRIRQFRSHKTKPSQGSSNSLTEKAPVGGGNWLESAQDIASFTLRQSYANTLAKEHSKTHAYVWALTLPSGVIHAFAVGSEELRKEWILTANYWSARLTKEPLMGGVSSVEYGWSDSVLSKATEEIVASPPHTGVSRADSSMNAQATTAGASSDSRSNTIASYQQASATATSVRPASSLSSSVSLDIGGRHRLAVDRTIVTDWRAPVSSVMSSQLMEVDQRNALQTYVTSLEEDLKKHNELRPLMARAFPLRSANSTRAMNNWNQKCRYLHTEIFKFKTYVESLDLASKAKEDVYYEREERKQKLKEMELEAENEKMKEAFVIGGARNNST